MKMMSVNGVHLHYADSGRPDGTALVFINSLGTDFRVWDAVLAPFEEHYRIIRYDKRGHGLSELSPSALTLDDLVADLDGLLGRLGISRAIPVGLSVGGLIAQGFAAKRPDLVAGMVLSDTAARIGTQDMWNDRMALIETNGLDAIADGVMERWFPAPFRASRPDELAGWKAMLTRTPAQGYLDVCKVLRDSDHTEQTRRLTLPVMAICGTEDGATPPALVKATAELIDGASYVEIPAAGHLPCADQPEAVIAAMTRFFKEADLV